MGLSSEYAGNACAFSIKLPATTVLAAPIIKSPMCGTRTAFGLVRFHLAAAKGTWSDFKTEFQYKSGNQWITSNILEEIDQDKPATKYGAAIPVEVLMNNRLYGSVDWRWRARMHTEQMPEIFRNTTEGAYSPWCEFAVGTPLQRAAGTNDPGIGKMVPGETPPAGGLGSPGSGFMMQRGVTPSANVPVAPTGNNLPKLQAPGTAPISRPVAVPAPAVRPAAVPDNATPNPAQGSGSTPSTQPSGIIQPSGPVPSGSPAAAVNESSSARIPRCLRQHLGPPSLHSQ